MKLMKIMMMMMTSPVCLMVFNLALLLVDTATGQSCKNFQTFNTQLIKLNHGKTNTLVKNLKSSNADFICLQEVWNLEDVTDIANQMKSAFPYHYSAPHKEQTKPSTGIPGFTTSSTAACTIIDAVNIRYWAASCGQGCFSKQSSKAQLTYCLLTSCKKVLTTTNPVSTSCSACLFLSPEAKVTDAVEQCLNVNWNGPGLMILSKTQLKNPTYNNYLPGKSTFIERGYIQTTLDNGITAVCTHLTSIEAVYFEVDLPYKNYEAQQAAEIKVLNTKFTQKDHNIVVMGDLNMGPTKSGIGERNLTAVAENNYKTMVNHGYRSPYVSDDGRCTYCHSTNPPMAKQVIDHILVKGKEFTTSNAKRLYDAGNPPFSDHYGVGLQVCS